MEAVFIALTAIVFGGLGIIWGLTSEWHKSWGEKEGKKIPGLRVSMLLIGLVVLGGGFALLTLDMLYPDGSSRSTRKYLSESTQRKIFYDMIATQDQNPYSNEWNQSVKEAAAKHYNIPMSQIGEIIRRGATEGWLQPNPP